MTSNQTKKILYVEDDQASLTLMAHLLRKDYEIDGVQNAEQAIKMAQSKFYDLVLMDIKLGPIGMNGLEVARKIRKIPNYEDIPIIAVTAYAMAGDRENLLKNGCNDYVSKPLDFSKLKMAIKRQLFEPEQRNSVLA